MAENKYVQGKIVGPVFVLNQIALSMGLVSVLGKEINISFILYLVLSRLINSKSRLSSVRLAEIHYGCELLGIEELNEDLLYAAMDWLYENKEAIENRLFKQWKKSKKNQDSNSLFLYDVSSSYLEGDKNELAEWGYNRDKKQGKKQIVYGLLTDDQGDPLAVEVFQGNTSDPSTLSTQINTLKKRFQCKHVTLVGDKGMIKRTGIEELQENEFNYITTITKPQIKTLLNQGVLQLGLFDETICEIEDKTEKVRYIYRKNPYRAEDSKNKRLNKIKTLEQKIEKSNCYLLEHPRASIEVQIKQLNEWLNKRKMSAFAGIVVNQEKNALSLTIDTAELTEAGRLDGCYVMKTNLPKEVADKETIHDRYKDLALVEKAFRIKKSELNTRPIYVRKKERTIAHVFIVTLAYKIERYLRNRWMDLNLTVSEGIEFLSQISSVIFQTGDTTVHKIHELNSMNQKLLEKLNLKMPKVLPNPKVIIRTKDISLKRH